MKTKYKAIANLYALSCSTRFLIIQLNQYLINKEK